MDTVCVRARTAAPQFCTGAHCSAFVLLAAVAAYPYHSRHGCLSLVSESVFYQYEHISKGLRHGFSKVTQGMYIGLLRHAKHVWDFSWCAGLLCSMRCVA